MNVLSELPLGFGMALAQYPEAMKIFSDMDESQNKGYLMKFTVSNLKKKCKHMLKPSPIMGDVLSGEFML